MISDLRSLVEAALVATGQPADTLEVISHQSRPATATESAAWLVGVLRLDDSAHPMTALSKGGTEGEACDGAWRQIQRHAQQAVRATEGRLVMAERSLQQAIDAVVGVRMEIVMATRLWKAVTE